MTVIKDKLVLVTGGLGYVGTVLVPHLAKKWPIRVYDSMMFGNSIEGTPNVEFIKGDITDWWTLGKALARVTDVVHLAGVVTDALVDMNPQKAMKVNEQATRSLCRLALSAGIRRFVYAGSSSVYGARDEPAKETDEPKPMTKYAETKLNAERICLEHNGAMTVTSIRSATCCGPAPRMRLDTIVNVFCKQAFFDGAIYVEGGDQWRSNVHVMDVARAYEAILDAPREEVAGEIFNVTHSNMTALEIAEIVLKAIPADITVDVDKKDNRHYKMDASKIRDILGWSPVRDITKAAIDNRNWFIRGGVPNPNDPIYWNTRRMESYMKENK